MPVYSPGQTGETVSPSLFFSTTYANKRTRGGQIVPVFAGCHLAPGHIHRAIRSGPGLGRIPPPTFQIVPVAHGRAFDSSFCLGLPTTSLLVSGRGCVLAGSNRIQIDAPFSQGAGVSSLGRFPPHRGTVGCFPVLPLLAATNQNAVLIAAIFFAAISFSFNFTYSDSFSTSLSAAL